MKRLLQNLIVAILAFLIGVSAPSLLNTISDAIVDSIPLDDSMCYEYTPRVQVIDLKTGERHCEGGQRRRIPNCP